VTAASAPTPAIDRRAAAQTVADRVLALVRERAGEAAETEATVRLGTSALTRFATSFIHQNVAEEISHILLRVALDGRNASSSLDGPTDDATLTRLVDDVLAAVRIAPIDPGWPGLTPPMPLGDLARVDHWDDATAADDPAERARRIRAFVDAADGLETAGFCSTAATAVAFANSAGQRLVGRRTTANVDGIARTTTADGSGHHASVRLADLDGAAVGAEAARRARDASDPTDLEPGRYEVVLGSQCVANLLSFLLLYGFNGRAVEEDRSFVRLGEPQFDAAITLRDDVSAPETVGVPFDSEGTPKRPLDLVRNGVTSGVLHTRRTARAVGGGAHSTGHAVEGGGSWGALGANFDLAAGTRTDDELIAGVQRGVLVTDFWYTRILDPRTEVVTGLTRNGVWLIEDGRIARPLTNLRFTQSFIDALGPGAVRGIGSKRALMIMEGWGSAFVVPSLHLASWNFTGGARG
jgi:predicted Zn-dependent protease